MNALWKKGGPSPNPGGRPSQLTNFTEKCRKLSLEEGFSLFERIIKDENAPLRERIVCVIENNKRAWGMPRQSITLSEEISSKAPEMTTEQLRNAILQFGEMHSQLKILMDKALLENVREEKVIK